MIDQLEDEVEIVERHLEILQNVVEHEPIGIVRLSNGLGYAHHKIRYSLRTLQERDLIRPTDEGAMTTDQTTAFVSNLDTELTGLKNRVAAMKFDDGKEEEI